MSLTRVPSPCQDDPSHVLGIYFGSVEAIANHFNDISGVVKFLHKELHLLDHVGTGLVLTRRCADVCKITHLLRARGNVLQNHTLEGFDVTLREGIELILGQSISDLSFQQASVGIQDGGLGFRRCIDSALPCFVASRKGIRHLAAPPFDDLNVTGLVNTNAQRIFDEELQAAIEMLVALLSPEDAHHIHQIIEGCNDDVEHGSSEGGHGLPGDSLIMPAGVEDPEFCQRDDRNLQAQLCGVFDKLRFDKIENALFSERDWHAWRRIRELRDPSVSHDWLWALNPAHGISVSKEEFALGIRLRIGVPFFENVVECAYCGDATLDPYGSHCLRCALGPSNCGHNAVRDEVLGVAHLADPTALKEAINLIPNFPLLRPADVLTSSAIPGW